MLLRCALLVALVSLPAHAWVRSRSNGGTALFWPGASVSIQLDAAGSLDLPLPAVMTILRRSVASWQVLTGPCSYLKLNVLDPAPLDTAIDGMQAVKFRRPSRWCRPADGRLAEVCYSPQASAITTVSYTTAPGKCDDGAILDADIQLNEIHFTFQWIEPCDGQAGCPTVSAIRADPATGMATSRADLENTLTHELGHLQGLEHTCWDRTLPAPPVDHTGKAIPSCEELANPAKVPPEEAARITRSTMYNFAGPGDVSKRTPESDDVAGVCGVYPVASPPRACGGGCSVGRGAPSGIVALLFAALALPRRRR